MKQLVFERKEPYYLVYFAVQEKKNRLSAMAKKRFVIMTVLDFLLPKVKEIIDHPF